MQRRFLCAFSIAISVAYSFGFVSVSPVSAGTIQHKSHGKSHADGHHLPHQYKTTHGKGYPHAPTHMRMGASSPPPASQPISRPVAVPVAAPLFVLPLNPVFPAPRQILGLAPEPTYPLSQPIYLPAREQTAKYHAPEPSSFVPTDPRAVIAELPSGRIFMGAPARVYYPQQYGRKWSRTYDTRPYAPPSIQIIGDLSRKHMSSPVRLTHGTPVSKRFDTGPKVVWIKAERAEQQSSSPQTSYSNVRHLK
jgi:hypothetical protein